MTNTSIPATETADNSSAKSYIPTTSLCKENAPCFSRFDKIYLVSSHLTRNRITATTAELNRVGIYNFDTYIEIPSYFRDILYRALKSTGELSKWLLQHPSAFNVLLGHYMAISQAYASGAKSMLLFEDDIRFLKDYTVFHKAIETLPDSFFVANLDTNARKNRLPQYSAHIENFYKTHPRTKEVQWVKLSPTEDIIRCSSCVALSRPAMQWFIKMVEAVRPIRHNDTYYNPKHLCELVSYSYIAAPPPAIQCINTGTKTNSAAEALSEYHKIRQTVFGNLSDYNI